MVEHTGCAAWSEFTEECWDSGAALPANATICKAAAAQPARSLTAESGTVCITDLYFWDGS